MEKKMRLDKFLTEMAVGTRSKVKDLAKKGRIRVNGETVTKTDIKIDPKTDVVAFDGVSIVYAAMEYYMLNKPKGVVSATQDNVHRTVIDLIMNQPPQGGSGGNGEAHGPGRKDLFPVGRLDIDTEGLLLITNDGELAHSLLSPRRHVDKVYYAEVTGILPDNAAEQFAEGITLLDGTLTMGAKLEIVSDGQNLNTGNVAETDSMVIEGGELSESDSPPERDGLAEGDNKPLSVTQVKLTIHEGKFHQVKRMFEALGCKVVFLKRLSVGSLKLDETLRPGEYRPLSEEEIEGLKGRG